MSNNIKCGRYNFCVGIEPDNNIYCYGSSQGCLWNQNPSSCNSDSDCAEYNTSSPKFDGGPAESICSLGSPQSWESDACPTNYNLYINSNPCNNPPMSSTELLCYQNNNPDLNGLTTPS